MKVHRYASLPHYRDHLEPIWRALPEDLRGESWAPRTPAGWTRLPHPRLMPTGPVMVAGFADVSKMAGRPLIYVEHGAGQTYPGDARSATNGSYSGGIGLGDVVLFLGPSELVAGRWRDRYPAPAVAVGSPRLDPWHARDSRAAVTKTPPTVAVTFHWECPLIPETRSAWPHYDAALPALLSVWRAAGVTVLGHGHPRLWGKIQRRWRQLSVEPVEHFTDILDRADLLIGDNTSALPEFASTDRPVVWLSAPWYRTDVDHGGRFWDWPAGQIQVGHPDELAGAVEIALTDPLSIAASRARMVAEVYCATDGHAARRAADAIREVIGQ